MKKAIIYSLLLTSVFFGCSKKTEENSSVSEETALSIDQNFDEDLTEEAIAETNQVKKNENIVTSQNDQKRIQASNEAWAMKEDEIEKKLEKPIAAIEKNIQEYSKTEFGIMLDRQDRRIMELTSVRTVERMDKGDPLTIGDIIKLSQSGISDDVVVNYILQTRTSYNLSQSQIVRLQESGVSKRIINHMIGSGK